MNIKKIILSHRILYEIYFFLSGKKLKKRKIDKKVCKLKICESTVIPDLIVSLTSYGERLSDLKYTLYSLVTQTVKPEKIIVWLAYGEIVPNEIKIFEKFGVEFDFCEDLKSYKKLIPSIQKYPHKFIVTADDDLFYRKNWLEEIWNCHLRYPTDKITHIAHRMVFDTNNILQNYNFWEKAVSKTEGCLFPTGGGGTLYLPGENYEDICKSEIFMKLCPKADDVWFFFMGFLKQEKVRLVSKPHNKLKYVDIYKEYGLNGRYSLQSENVGENLNDQQIRNVMNYYKILDTDLIDNM